MSDKRIIDLEAKQTIGSGDYLAADSAQGTYKVDADTNIMTPLTNVRNNVANGSASPDKYSSSTAYKVGDMVIHDDILYICTTACSAASWAVNSACFTATTLASAITQLNSDLNNIGNITEIGFTTLSSYTDFTFDPSLYRELFLYIGLKENTGGGLFLTAVYASQSIPIKMFINTTNDIEFLAKLITANNTQIVASAKRKDSTTLSIKSNNSNYFAGIVGVK